eukprot:3618005-Pyramimonas_sp.AAC.1
MELKDDKGKAAAGSAAGRSDAPKAVPYENRLLIKALLRAIALAQSAPGNTSRIQGLESGTLAACLYVIYKRAKEFGGGVFSLAASVMRLIIHHDPTCFPQLEAAGLPAAFLEAIQEGVAPCADAVCCVPNTLTALCLNTQGLERVRTAGGVGPCGALSCFVPMFTTKAYIRPLKGETPAVLGTGLDELMRHVPSLRPIGMEMAVQILKALCALGGATPKGDDGATSGDADDSDSSDPMDTEGGAAATGAD